MLLKELTEKALTEHWSKLRNYYSKKGHCRDFVSILGNVQVKKINGMSISNLMVGLEDKGNSRSTVNLKIKTFRTLLNLACDYGFIESLPRFKNFIIKDRPGRTKVFTAQEESTVLSYFNEEGLHEMGDLVTVLIDTGLRLSEALNLEKRDIDLELNLLTIWENKDDLPRSVKMTKRVQAVFEQREVFMLNKNQAEYLWRKARIALSCTSDKEFVIHALRHTCASRLVQRGVPLYTVQRWLGHRSIQYTERYAHLDPGQFDSAVSVLEPTIT